MAHTKNSLFGKKNSVLIKQYLPLGIVIFLGLTTALIILITQTQVQDTRSRASESPYGGTPTGGGTGAGAGAVACKCQNWASCGEVHDNTDSCRKFLCVKRSETQGEWVDIGVATHPQCGQPAHPTSCGDGRCEGGEGLTTCPQDCKTIIEEKVSQDDRTKTYGANAGMGGGGARFTEPAAPTQAPTWWTALLQVLQSANQLTANLQALLQQIIGR